MKSIHYHFIFVVLCVCCSANTRAFVAPVVSFRTTTTSPTRSALFDINPSSLLYAEHEKLLVRRGELEAELMAAAPSKALEPNIVKGGGGGGAGFGGGAAANRGKTQKALLKAQAKSHARGLQEQGVVRIDHVLDADLADSLRSRLYALREESEQLIADGTLDSKARFADVLLTHNRRDMTLPIGPKWAATALSKVLLESSVGLTLETLLGKDALLREWSCLMSDPGSQRQVAHPDTPWQAEPVLYTCFVALQDITPDMGPTTWLPKTHTQAMHQLFQDESIAGPNSKSPKDELLSTCPSVLGTLPKGACAIFDSRLLHCGGANTSSKQLSRALLYCSFQNPNIRQVGNPGSIRKDLIGKWTLQSLVKELELFGKGKGNRVVVDDDEI